jgi:flagellar assembly protein FliH
MAQVGGRTADGTSEQGMLTSSPRTGDRSLTREGASSVPEAVNPTLSSWATGHPAAGAPANAVIRGAQASGVSAARFDVDLRAGFPVPPHILAEATAAAHAAGFAAGWAQGQQESAIHTEALHAQLRDEAHAAFAAQRQSATRAIAGIAAAADAFERAALPHATELEDLIMATAVGIAETLIGRELELSASPGADALARALALAPANRPVTVRVSPADHAALTAAGTATSAEVTGGRTVTLIADPQVRSGDALAESDSTAIDARISASLERIRQVLA